MSLLQRLFPTQKSFSVSVIDQKNLLFQGEVWGISSRNEKGIFSIRVLHTNFISVIQDELILWTDRQKKQSFPIDRGVLRCFDHKVDIYLGISRNV